MGTVELFNVEPLTGQKEMGGGTYKLGTPVSWGMGTAKDKDSIEENREVRMSKPDSIAWSQTTLD